MTLKDILNSDKLVLVDFFSADCPPCLLMKDVLIDVKNIVGEKCDIYTIDQKKHSEVFNAFGVKSVPHLKLFRKGKPIWSYSGLINKDEIILKIKENE